MNSTLFTTTKTADWLPAEDAVKGDVIVEQGLVFKVLDAYREQDEIVIVGGPKTIRRYEPDDLISIWKNGSLSPNVRVVTAADYMGMFTALLNNPELLAMCQKEHEGIREGGFAKGVVRDEIQWASRVLKKSDRIIWWLKWYRLGIVKRYLPEQLSKELAKIQGAVTSPEDIDPVIFQRYDTGVWKQYHQQLEHFYSTPCPQIQEWHPKADTPAQALTLTLPRMEEEWQATRKHIIVPQEGDEVVVSFPDGWAWWKLDRNYCPDESRAMGHCGNGASQDRDERILSLRQPTPTGEWEPHCTFILDPNGLIGEMKGRNNDKPVQKYHKYIIALLKSPIVKGIKGGGYWPEHNFSVMDLTEAEREDLYAAKPAMMPLKEYYKKFGVNDTFVAKVIARFKDDDPGDEVVWNPEKKEFQVGTWGDLKALVSDYGNSAAQWALGTFNGDEYMETDTGMSRAEEAKSMLEDLSADTVEKLGLILQHEYEDKITDWLEEEGYDPETDEFDPASEEDVYSFMVFVDDDELQDALSNAYTDGYQQGTEAEVMKAFKSAVEDSGYEPLTDEFWGGAWGEFMSPQVAMNLIDNGETLDDYRGESERKIEMSEPNYGYSDYDSDAAKEHFEDNYVVDETFTKTFGPDALSEFTEKKALHKKYMASYRLMVDTLRHHIQTLTPEEQEPWVKADAEFKDGNYQPLIDLVRKFDPNLWTWVEHPEPKTAAYNRDAWKTPEREYEGRFKADITDEERKTYFDRSHEWDQSALAALSTGALTPEQAKEQGIHTQPPASAFNPLPPTLYHVTTAATEVQQHGLMSRYELGMQSGIGLSGGSDHSVSFTTKLDTARAIYDGLILGQRSAAGTLQVPDMVDMAKSGNGGKSFYEGFVKALESTVGGKDPLKDVLSSFKVEMNMMAKPPKDDEGWEPVKDAHHWTGGDGVERYLYWQRPRTPEEMTYIRWQAFKAFLFAREQAGGPIDPLFFCTDTDSLAKVNPEEIAILEYKPVPGGKGTQESGLEEIRIYDGAAVKFVREVPGASKTASRIPTPQEAASAGCVFNPARRTDHPPTSEEFDYAMGVPENEEVPNDFPGFYQHQWDKESPSFTDFERKHWDKEAPNLAMTAAGTAAMRTVSFSKLWHVGEMDVTKKRHDSHEGDGLSVSTDPDAWEQINSFTSGPTWELTKAGNRFLDYHKLTKAQRKTIADWGVEAGYAEQAITYEVSWFDDELDEEVAFSFSTREEAEKEVGDEVDDGLSHKITERPGSYVATEKLRQRTQTRGENVMVADLLAVVYAEDELHLDGVWWRDRLDVAAYSAPRGVIFNSELPSWTKKQVKTASSAITRDNASWKGQPFGLAAVSLLDGRIEEVHSFKECRKLRWHHTHIFSEAITRQERSDVDWNSNVAEWPSSEDNPRRWNAHPGGNISFFWVNDDGTLGFNQPLPPEIQSKIHRQITLLPAKAGKQAAKDESLFDPWVGVDLDGCLSESLSDYSDPCLIGAPIPEMIEKVRLAFKAGFVVKVFTARVAEEETREKVTEAIQDWTEKHLGVRLGVTCEKTPGMIEFWDDRARKVVKNMGKFASAPFPTFDEFVKVWGGIVHGLTSKASAEALGDQLYPTWKKRYEDWVAFHSDQRYPRTIFRAIRVPDLKDIDTGKMGQCWSWDEDYAIYHGGSSADTGRDMIVRAKVGLDDIDWVETIHLNLEYDGNGMPEKEIWLKPRVEVEVTGVREDWAQSGKFEPFHREMVTAAAAAKEAVDLQALAQEWRRQAEAVAATNPPPLPDGTPWVPWELTKDKTYPIGTARITRSGRMETVTRMPIDKLEWIQESVNQDDVQKYRRDRVWEKSLPQVREFTNRYEIVDGHHRIQAAKEAGEKEVNVWLDRRESSPVYHEVLSRLGYDSMLIASAKYAFGKPSNSLLLGRAIRHFCRSDESFTLLDRTKGTGGTWTSGGCWILAHAIAKGFNGQVYCVMSRGDTLVEGNVTDEARAQHFVAKIGHLYLDADGASMKDTLLRRWKNLEHLHDPFLEPFEAQPTGETPAPELEDGIIAGIQAHLYNKGKKASRPQPVMQRFTVMAKAWRQMDAPIQDWQQGAEHIRLVDAVNEREAKRLVLAELNGTYSAFGVVFKVVSCYAYDDHNLLRFRCSHLCFPARKTPHGLTEPPPDGRRTAAIKLAWSRDEEDCLDDHFDSLDETASAVLSEYAAHRGEPDYRMHWDVVPAARLKKIWNDYVKMGFVRDEKGINEIAAVFIENVNKLSVNTILCGHSEQDPVGYAKGITGGEDLPEDYFDNDDRFFEDEKGSWLLSDYAIKPLMADSLKLRAAKTAEQKLQTIDHMLSIVHQRSDLAGWFVEGGRKTLSQLAGFSSKTASFGIPADLQAIEDKYKAQGVTIWMNHYQRDGDPYIELSSVEVPKNQRKQGLGTAFMTDLMKWADANGEPIFLTPSTSRGGSSVGRLQAFYGRFGFVRNHGRNKDFRSQDAMVRVPRGAAKTAAAKPESILVIVHPGSACGSADFNYGSRDTADAERTGLIREWTNWRGGVIVIDGELSDELPDYPELNAALTSVVDRAKSAGKVSLREYGQDPAQVRVIKQVVKTRGWTPADVQFSCTGAWAYSDSDGCVGDVNKVLRQMGFSSKITDAALTGEWG